MKLYCHGPPGFFHRYYCVDCYLVGIVWLYLFLFGCIFSTHSTFMLFMQNFCMVWIVILPFWYYWSVLCLFCSGWTSKFLTQNPSLGRFFTFEAALVEDFLFQLFASYEERWFEEYAWAKTCLGDVSFGDTIHYSAFCYCGHSFCWLCPCEKMWVDFFCGGSKQSS